MKVITARFIKICIAAAYYICVIFNLSAIAQPTLKRPNRVKDFGQSLKEYEKTNEKTANRNAPEDEDTIRVDTNLVVNDVLVVNQKGNAILGLKQSDFIVTENGEPQEIEIFSIGENAKIPRSIVLIIDHSSSLLPYLDNSIEAAKLLVDKLNPNDRMAIVTDDVKLLTDFTKDKSLLNKDLDKLKLRCESVVCGGKSWQYSALLAVLNEMFDDEDMHPIIIFQTDGDEFGFLKPIKYFSSEQEQKFPQLCKKYDKGYCERSYGFSDIKEKIEKSRATIYSIIPGLRFLGLSEEEKLKRGEISFYNKMKKLVKNYNERNLAALAKKYALQEASANTAWQTSLVEIANLSGGYADFLEKPENAEMIYSSIFQVIENRYVIGYYPKNEAKDGKRRNVKIEVKGHSEYIIVGRKSYIAPLERK